MVDWLEIYPGKFKGKYKYSKIDVFSNGKVYVEGDLELLPEYECDREDAKQIAELLEAFAKQIRTYYKV